MLTAFCEVRESVEMGSKSASKFKIDATSQMPTLCQSKTEKDAEYMNSVLRKLKSLRIVLVACSGQISSEIISNCQQLNNVVALPNIPLVHMEYLSRFFGCTIAADLNEMSIMDCSYLDAKLKLVESSVLNVDFFVNVQLQYDKKMPVLPSCHPTKPYSLLISSRTNALCEEIETRFWSSLHRNRNIARLGRASHGGGRAEVELAEYLKKLHGPKPIIEGFRSVLVKYGKLVQRNTSISGKRRRHYDDTYGKQQALLRAVGLCELILRTKT